MYAVVKTGGKQYRVEEGATISVEKLDAEAGSTLTLDDVLLIGEGSDVKAGTPTVDGAKVEAEVVDHTRDKKILIFKKKRRQTYRRKKGHRQHKTLLKINKISA
jgi:large subunit ribosomal protein L21